MDDFYLVHDSKERLEGAVPLIEDFLWTHLSLSLNAREGFLKHFCARAAEKSSSSTEADTVRKRHAAAAIEDFAETSSLQKSVPVKRLRIYSVWKRPQVAAAALSCSPPDFVATHDPTLDHPSGEVFRLFANRDTL